MTYEIRAFALAGVQTTPLAPAPVPNFLPASEISFSIGSGTNWIATNGSNSTGQSDPTGGTDAIGFSDNSSNAQHYVILSPYLSIAAGTYTVQCYAKPSGFPKVQLQLTANVTVTSGAGQTFDLSNGTPSGAGFSYGADVTFISANIGTDAFATGATGNGWYRLQITGTIVAGTSNIGMLMAINGGNTYVGSGTLGAYFAIPIVIASAPAFNTTDVATSIALSNGNLTAGVNTNVSNVNVRSNVHAKSGKFYFECTLAAGSVGDIGPGICDASQGLTGSNISAHGAMGLNGTAFAGAGGSVGSIPAVAIGQVMGIAVDLAAQRIWFCNATSNNGVWNAGGSANPATNVGGYSFAGATSGPVWAALALFSGGTTLQQGTVNFGASAYAGTVPAGYGNW